MINLAAMALSLALCSDPISNALERFALVDSYRVTLRTDRGEVIKYFYKKPGFVRMEFVNPYKGAVLTYDPGKKKAQLRPFGFLKPLVLSFGPSSPIIKSSGGHTVDQSDIGSLIKAVVKLRDSGKAESGGEEAVDGRETAIVNIKGKKGFSIDGINGYKIWFDKNICLPIKVRAFNDEGTVVEEVLMDDLETGVEIPEGYFDLR